MKSITKYKMKFHEIKKCFVKIPNFFQFERIKNELCCSAHFAIIII